MDLMKVRVTCRIRMPSARTTTTGRWSKSPTRCTNATNSPVVIINSRISKQQGVTCSKLAHREEAWEPFSPVLQHLASNKPTPILQISLRLHLDRTQLLLHPHRAYSQDLQAQPIRTYSHRTRRLIRRRQINLRELNLLLNRSPSSTNHLVRLSPNLLKRKRPKNSCRASHLPLWEEILSALQPELPRASSKRQQMHLHNSHWRSQSRIKLRLVSKM